MRCAIERQQEYNVGIVFVGAQHFFANGANPKLMETLMDGNIHRYKGVGEHSEGKEIFFFSHYVHKSSSLFFLFHNPMLT